MNVRGVQGAGFKVQGSRGRVRARFGPMIPPARYLTPLQDRDNVALSDGPVGPQGVRRAGDRWGVRSWAQSGAILGVGRTTGVSGAVVWRRLRGCPAGPSRAARRRAPR